MARNHKTTQTSRVGGKNGEEIAGKINEAVSGAGHPVKNCIDHTLGELNQRIRDMHCHFSPHLEEVLKAGDGRQRRHSTLEDYERSWVAESETVARDPSAETPLKHAKCAEVLMLFTHHVPAAGKESLVHEMGFVAPTMPTYEESHAAHQDEKTARTYDSSYTCQTGHGILEATESGSDHVLPHWRAEHHYIGRGYGAYPFWLGGDGGCDGTNCGDGGNIEVWWSEKQAAEKFYHETCYMSEAGYSASSNSSVSGNKNAKPGALFGWAGNRGPMAGRARAASQMNQAKEVGPRGNLRRNLLQGPPPPPADDDGAGPPPPADDDRPSESTPCYNLMVGGLNEGAKAYLYTASEDFCCEASGTTEDLAPPQSDFMDYMTLAAKETITTAFYSGEAYRYTETLASSEAVDDFWYVTDLEGYPLQQGEGGTSMTQTGGRGVFIYHEYNKTTWAENVTIDEDVFAVPSICLSASTTKCNFP
jgi:hypothetical protein